MYDVVRSLSHLLISCLSYTKVYNRYLKGSHLSGALDGRDVSNWRLHPKALLICIAVALRSCCSSNLCAPHTNLCFGFPLIPSGILSLPPFAHPIPWIHSESVSNPSCFSLLLTMHSGWLSASDSFAQIIMAPCKYFAYLLNYLYIYIYNTIQFAFV